MAMHRFVLIKYSDSAVSFGASLFSFFRGYLSIGHVKINTVVASINVIEIQALIKGKTGLSVADWKERGVSKHTSLSIHGLL
jgi:hypothetical protein